jgi:hypothetical protein
MTEGVVDVARRERTDLAAWACLRKVLWNMMDEGYLKLKKEYGALKGGKCKQCEAVVGASSFPDRKTELSKLQAWHHLTAYCFGSR